MSAALSYRMEEQSAPCRKCRRFGTSLDHVITTTKTSCEGTGWGTTGRLARSDCCRRASTSGRPPPSAAAPSAWPWSTRPGTTSRGTSSSRSPPAQTFTKTVYDGRFFRSRVLPRMLHWHCLVPLDTFLRRRRSPIFLRRLAVLRHELNVSKSLRAMFPLPALRILERFWSLSCQGCSRIVKSSRNRSHGRDSSREF